MKTPRTFPAPAVVGGGAYTCDELEMLSGDNSELGVWAGRTYRKERDRLLESLSALTVLPQLAIATDEYGDDCTVALKYDDRYYASGGWLDDPTALVMEPTRYENCSADDAAFAARAFNEGVEMVYFRPVMPAAWLDELATSLVAAADVPEGAKFAAVVDELDKTAVLDLLAVAPGPIVFRRHDGKWREDTTWLHVLKSVKPPPLVIIQPEQLESITAQVDTATAGQPFDKNAEDDESDETAVTSSAYDPIVARDLQIGITLALRAAGNPAKGAAGAERLRRYWLTGKGAAKIRWGTPGDWTRCVKHLSKHLGPRAKGYCQLMHGRATGTWAGRNQSKVPSAAVKAEAVAKQLSR